MTSDRIGRANARIVLAIARIWVPMFVVDNKLKTGLVAGVYRCACKTVLFVTVTSFEGKLVNGLGREADCKDVLPRDYCPVQQWQAISQVQHLAAPRSKAISDTRTCNAPRPHRVRLRARHGAVLVVHHRQAALAAATRTRWAVSLGGSGTQHSLDRWLGCRAT